MKLINGKVVKNPFWEKQMGIYAQVFNSRTVNKSQWEENVSKIDVMIKENFTSFSVDESIARIRQHTNLKNIDDNDIVIQFLKGNNEAIWELYLKYKKLYMRVIKNSLVTNIKSSEISYEDMVMEAFFITIDLVKKGRYKGINFKNYSLEVIKYYGFDYYKINAKTVEYKGGNLYRKGVRVKPL